MAGVECIDSGDPAARDFFIDWHRAADDIAGMLRTEAARDLRLIELIGELSTRSEEFARDREAHNVRFHRTGNKTQHHAVVDALDLGLGAMEFPADLDRTCWYTPAASGPPTADALKLLVNRYHRSHPRDPAR
ncbi:hypothetical protein [Nocardia sp. NBC_01388]|uniref:MmyB family transcriptional regulator n=1 Tax=Nocardia sp. NBC_01388 TaxID=2903596 RepID=UPI0032474645